MNNYQQMWEDLGKLKAPAYLSTKFDPFHRIGLTNYLREESIKELVNPKKNDIILDTGCASGRLLHQLAKQIKHGYGIDIAQSFIDMASSYATKHKLNNLTFSQSVIEKVLFPSHFFDKIICAEVLEHLPDENIALLELKRVLKPKGLLIITVPNLNADGTLWGRLLRLLRLKKFQPLPHFSLAEIIKHKDAHVREFNHQSLLALTRAHQLKLIKLSSISFIDGPYFEILLNYLLSLPQLRSLIISLEKKLTQTNLTFGRHLVVKLQKE